MPNSTERDLYERSLHQAHQGLYWASVRAEQQGDEGAYEDLTALIGHVQVLVDESLRGRRHRRADMLHQAAA